MAKSVLNQARKILSSFDPTDDDGIIWCIGTTLDNKKIPLHLMGSITEPQIWEAFGYGVPSNARLKKIRIDGRMMQ